MQKLLTGLGISRMVVLLVFSSAFSMSGTQSTVAQEIQWQEMEGKTTKELDKTWTIKFTTNLDASSINEDNLFIVNADGEKVETAFTVDENLVKVSPKADYVNGQYTLYISPDIKSVKGKALKTPIKFPFLVDADVIGTPVIFPSNQIPMNFADGGFRLAVELTAGTNKLKAYENELKKGAPC
ncbi:Ig-like domain-containing protein [Domibacillus sp. PGB-M46]|uniref:Ig-like domain-containing protein n=1 Tax=Domibacillus sp. PGB-M46 TaxID=2910255 RepID=UPI001F58C46C|nr:Ig-like domain-containing protein [Domibacillus sp. PGB-M46]MCI2253120.1 Ig-like domain-containing protein [Domibacillus sp. PGB-M46]